MSALRWNLYEHHVCTETRRICVSKQDPDARPGAEALQKHEFVAGPHVNAASALLPLIQHSRSLVANLYAESDGPPRLPTGVE